jgi:hypothetical protein
MPLDGFSVLRVLRFPMTTPGALVGASSGMLWGCEGPRALRAPCSKAARLKRARRAHFSFPVGVSLHVPDHGLSAFADMHMLDAHVL